VFLFVSEMNLMTLTSLRYQSSYFEKYFGIFENLVILKKQNIHIVKKWALMKITRDKIIGVLQSILKSALK